MREGGEVRLAQPAAATGEGLVEFVAMMRLMRERCAWKSSQTHRSLARYLLEETHETLEAIDAGDADHLAEELGDLLLQIYFHAAIAEAAGDFTMDDVVAVLSRKMVRRNPHVFGPDSGPDTAVPRSIEEIEAAWQAAKAAEKERPTGLAGVTDGIPATLPALLYADKVLGRLERHGEGGSATVPGAAPGEPSSLGDRLLALVAEGRREGLDPEQELRDAVRRRLLSQGPRSEA